MALKVYQPDRLHIISQYQLKREARLHAQLSHPNIIRLHAAFQQVRSPLPLCRWRAVGKICQAVPVCILLDQH